MSQAARATGDNISSMIGRETPLTTLHLLRALHREASYLPDPASRTFVRTQIRNRFHHNRDRPAAGKEKIPQTEIKEPAEGFTITWVRKKASRRTTSLLAEGRYQLQMLKRANSGEPKPLTKILEQTYGRRGKRKHDLLRDLALQGSSLRLQSSSLQSDDFRRELSKALVPQSNSNEEKDSNYGSNNSNNNEGTRAKMPLFSDKFVALVRSQMNQKQDHFSKPLPQSTRPKIPEINSMGRKMPAARAKNLTKKWYAQTLDRLMAPLPEAEWIHLGNLAVGNVMWAGPPERRSAGTVPLESSPQMNEKASWSKPQKRAERERIDRLRAREQHEITPRYMRRMWASVFAQCPLMKWDAEKARWNITWGKVDGEKRLVVSMDQPDLDVSLFEGVDEKGKILKE